MKLFFVEQAIENSEDGGALVIPTNVHTELRDAIMSFIKNDASEILVAKVARSETSLDLFSGKEIIIAERAERHFVVNTADELDLGNLRSYVPEDMTLVNQHMSFSDMAIMGRNGYYSGTAPLQKGRVTVVSVCIRPDVQRMFADTATAFSGRQVKETELMQALEKELTINE